MFFIYYLVPHHYSDCPVLCHASDRDSVLHSEYYTGRSLPVGLCTFWNANWSSMLISLLRELAALSRCFRLFPGFWNNHSNVLKQKSGCISYIVFADLKLNRVFVLSYILLFPCKFELSHSLKTISHFSITWFNVCLLVCHCSFKMSHVISSELNRCSIYCSRSTILSNNESFDSLFWISFNVSARFDMNVDICGMYPWPCPLFTSICGAFDYLGRRV